MCIVSMIHDHYQPQFEPYKWVSSTTTPGAGTFAFGPTVDVEKLEKLIKDFNEAIFAAARLDVLTKQPDCVDPEKAMLQERVAELEKQLQAVRDAAGGGK